MKKGLTSAQLPAPNTMRISERVITEIQDRRTADSLANVKFLELPRRTQAKMKWGGDRDIHPESLLEAGGSSMEARIDVRIAFPNCPWF